MCVCVHVCSEVLLILGGILQLETVDTPDLGEKQFFLELLMNTGTKPRDLDSWFGLVFVV